MGVLASLKSYFRHHHDLSSVPEYANDDEAATLRRESLKELSLNKPVINVQPDTPETLTRGTGSIF